MSFSEIDLPLAALLQIAQGYPSNPCPAVDLQAILEQMAPLVELSVTELRTIVDIESDAFNPQRHPSGISADYYMTSATYRGVVQTSLSNWQDAREWLQLSGDTKKFALLVGPSPSSSTPAYQLAMMFVYAMRYRRSVGEAQWSSRTLYTLHNQGPGGLRVFAETGVLAGKQSAVAVAFMSGKKTRPVRAIKR